jgi:pimeloyl-ACP methyl ester carboxylesterase
LRANNFAGVPESTRVKLPAGKTWEALANMSPEQHLGKIEQARR